MKNVCQICKNEYESNQPSKYCSTLCRTFAFNQRKISKLDETNYVICKICDFKFKEINNDHTFKQHGISCLDYDNIYGYNLRTSTKTKENKNTLRNMTNELSEKLKKSHYLPAYIEKYGNDEGNRRYNLKIKIYYRKIKIL